MSERRDSVVLNSVTYFPILGVPLIAYIGTVTLVLVLSAFYLGYRGKDVFRWHTRLATAALVFALIHGVLGILAYL